MHNSNSIMLQNVIVLKSTDPDQFITMTSSIHACKSALSQPCLQHVVVLCSHVHVGHQIKCSIGGKHPLPLACNTRNLILCERRDL